MHTTKYPKCLVDVEVFLALSDSDGFVLRIVCLDFWARQKRPKKHAPCHRTWETTAMSHAIEKFRALRIFSSLFRPLNKSLRFAP